MRLEQLAAIHPTNNIRCEGDNCQCPDSKVRIIPLDDSYNANLCQCCYDIELGVSLDRIAEGLDPYLPCLPFDVYPLYHGE